MEVNISREDVLAALEAANSSNSNKLGAGLISCETCENVLHTMLDEAIIAALAGVTAKGAKWYFELPEWFTTFLAGLLAVSLRDLQKLFELEIPEPTADAIIRGLCTQFCPS